MENKRLNIGMIGLGRLGYNYVDYLVNRIPAARLVAVSDVDESQLQSVSEKFAVPKTYRDYADLIADKEVDAIVIVTPTRTHLEIVVEAARQGKAVFCEKPLSISLEDAIVMSEEVNKSGIFFHMGFMRRFDRGYLAARKKVEEGVIGSPVVFKSTSRDPHRPSLEYANPVNSGGLITDMGIHDFDLARWFMGEIRSVYSTGGTLAYPEMKSVNDIDNAVINMYFESEALGAVDLSRNGVYGYDIRTEILGTKGALQVGYLRETPVTVLVKEGVTHDVVPFFMERFEQAYITQLQEFVTYVLEDKEPTVTCEDGVAALQVSLAATKSHKDNKPVEVSEIVSTVS